LRPSRCIGHRVESVKPRKTLSVTSAIAVNPAAREASHQP
jgi:hypothetical protein